MVEWGGKTKQLQNYLAHQEIRWQFHLSIAPWWGRHFKRILGVVKQALHKTIGRASLTWNEPAEVLLDLEIAPNDHPLSYVEDDVQLLVLTP